jgi:hypothetical protein
LVPITVVVFVASAEHGCQELLGPRTKNEKPGEFREQPFGAGRTHTRVALVLSLEARRRIALEKERERHERSGWH